MKSPLLAILMASVVAVSGPAAAATGTTHAPDDAKQPATAESKSGRPSVSLGMTTEEVAKTIGRPGEIKAVNTPAGDGEEWIYRRLAKEWTQQTAATTQSTPGFVGLGIPDGGIGEVAVAINHIERVKLFQVSSLLFIEGKLAAAKQWPERESRIEN